MSSSEILDVDLAGFESGDFIRRRAVIDGVRRSLGTAFVVVRSPISEDFLDDVYSALLRFFSLGGDLKMRCFVEGGMGQTGYTPATISERAVGATVPDAKEMFNWGTELPPGHPLFDRFPHRYIRREMPEAFVPGVAEMLDRFHSEMTSLQRRLLRVIAVDMGCREDFFENMVTDGPHLARAVSYPSKHGAPEGALGAAAHTDINLTTVMPRATRPGLQLLLHETWRDVVTPSGYAVINTGDMLCRLSNNKYGEGEHRVLLGDEPRLSVVQFLHPTPWTVLSPVSSCCTSDNPQRYSAISAGDWLDMRLHELGLYRR